MPEQQLDAPYIGSLLEQMYRKCVPQRVRSYGFGDAGELRRFPARPFHGVAGDVLTRDIAREEPGLGFFKPPPLPQDLQQSGGKHDEAIPLPLALLDANDHALAVNLGRF